MLAGSSAVGGASVRAPLYSTANILYIKNLSPLVTGDHIRQIFSHCGEILTIGFKAYTNNPAQRYCVLEFRDSAGITAASQLNNTPLLNVPMVVTVVEPAGGGTFIAPPEALATSGSGSTAASLEALAKQAALNVQQPVGLAQPAVGEGMRQLQQLQQLQLQQFEANSAGALGAGAQLATAGAVAALGGQAGGAAAFGAMPLNSQMSVVEIAMQNHLSNLQAVQSAALQAKILAEKKKTELGLGVSIGPGAGGLLPAAASLVTGCPYKETELQQLGRTLFVENFPEEYEKEELRLLLRDFGKISDLRVDQHPEKKSKFAVVEFETAEEAQFVRGMDGKPIGNLTLTIKASQSLVTFRDPDGVLFDVPPPPILAVLKQQQTPEAQQEALQNKLKEVKYAKMEIEDKLKGPNGLKSRPKRESSRSRAGGGSGRSLLRGRDRRGASSRSRSRPLRSSSGRRRSVDRREESRRMGSEGAKDRVLAGASGALRSVEQRRSISRSPDDAVDEMRQAPTPSAQKAEQKGDDREVSMSPRATDREGEGGSGRKGGKRVSRSVSQDAGARKLAGSGDVLEKSPRETTGPGEAPLSVKDEKKPGHAGENGVAYAEDASGGPSSPGFAPSTKDSKKERDGRGRESRSPRRQEGPSSKRGDFSSGTSRSPSTERRKTLKDREMPKRGVDASLSRSPSGTRRKAPSSGPPAQRGADPRRPSSSSRSPRGRSNPRWRSSSFSRKKEDGRDLSRERSGRDGPRRPSLDGRRGGPGDRCARRSGSRRRSSVSDSDRSSFSPGRPRRVPPGLRGRRRLSGDDRDLSSSEPGAAYGRPRPRGLPARPDSGERGSPFSRRRRRSVSRSGDRNSVEDGRLSRGGSRSRGPGRPGAGRRGSIRLEEEMRDRDDDYPHRGGFPGSRARGDRRGGAPSPYRPPGGRKAGSREPSFGREMHPVERGDGLGGRSGARMPVRGRPSGAQLADTANTWGGGPSRQDKKGPLGQGGMGPRGEDGVFGLREGPRGRGRQAGRRRLGRRGNESGDDGGRDARMDRYKSQSRSLSEDSDSSSSPVSARGENGGAKSGGPWSPVSRGARAGREADLGDGEKSSRAALEAGTRLERESGGRGPQGTGGSTERGGGSVGDGLSGAKETGVSGPHPSRAQPMNALCGGRPGASGTSGGA
ncbi:possible RNA-binding protein, related [Neospora caninum Liverpool]|uniref:Possible RNA-binding protein, related n=1 Tax=Neospora caninum (strain Liverpool) TaxID=572307 RepID=F0V7I1_NEOCL|nr:possible RNA-binding protein, related [Neospora caninum Liverpool]CBZ49672.1 possible RNA-binding protein, related [Neospora caninum Liverpool]|eukprot:XP_003879707.1 possible RNA-binding protein, related [Neospora caninum Liverpool]